MESKVLLMKKSALIEIVEEILELDSGTVLFENELEKLGWDSVANIMFIAEIDRRLGRTIDANNLNAAKTVADLGSLLG